MKLAIDDVDVNRADGKTPLHLAAQIGHEEILCLLIEAGANVNEQRADGSTPLHKAAAGCRNKRIAELLVNAGADVSIENNEGATALQVALDCKNIDVTKVLIYARADVNTRSSKYRRTALHVAAAKNDVAFMEYLFYRGADVDAKDYQGSTPLHRAVLKNQGNSHLNAIRVLVDNNAELYAMDDNGRTPLDYLQKKTDAKILESVRDRLGDVSFSNELGKRNEEILPWERIEKKIEELNDNIKNKVNEVVYITAVHLLLLLSAFLLVLMLNFLFTD